MTIVRMKRVTFLGLAERGEALLRLLQKQGVLHPEPLREPAELPSLEQLEHLINVERAVLRDLGAVEVPEECEPLEVDPLSLGEAGVILYRLEEYAERQKKLEAVIEGSAPWGDIDQEELALLRDAGVFIQCWSLPKERFESAAFPEKVLMVPVQRGRQVLFATISRGEALSLEAAEEWVFPQKRLSALLEERAQLQAERLELLRKVAFLQEHRESLQKEHERRSQEFDFQVAKEHAFSDKAVMAVAGWIPAASEGPLRSAMERFPTPVVMRGRNPRPDESPPVLTKNPALVRAFEPLLGLFGVPDYKGVDPALFFAPFMMLFFGICLGDVGYGATMVIAALIIKALARSKGEAIKPIIRMTIFFGIATMAHGALTGSYFGAFPWSRDRILLDVSHEFGNPMLLFQLAIGLGVLHLTIAFVLSAISAPSIHERIARIGSIALLWGGVLMVLKVQIWWILLAIGIVIVLLFSSDARNPLKRLGLGLWGLYGHTGLVGDLMSYSRLFGLGIATAAIASVVNTLATQAKDAVPGVGIIFFLLILIVGHCFNLAMGIISALVHPARLHAVEALPKFVNFTGRAYKPLTTD